MKKWSVTYVYHDKEEKFHCKAVIVEAETIMDAVKLVDVAVCDVFEHMNWADYTITGAYYVPELH